MKEIPVVSVIVPVFNGAATLAAAIDSIRAQCVPVEIGVEIIVVDDGSTDDTPQVMATLGDVVAIRRSNGGPAAARNSGLQLARAPVVAFLDADDVWMPDKLQLQLDRFQSYPSAAVIVGYTAFQTLDPETGLWLTLAAPHLLYHLGAALCRRDAFDQIGPLDPELQTSEDVDWFLRLRDAGLQIVVMREIVQVHRRHGANITRGKDLRSLRFIEVVKRSIDRRRAGKVSA